METIDDSTIKIGKNTVKSLGNLRRFAVTHSSGKPYANASMKKFHWIIIIIIIIIIMIWNAHKKIVRWYKADEVENLKYPNNLFLKNLT